MALKKDKEKVLDEVWTEDRVRSFLDLEPYDEVDADYYVLDKAYHAMRAEDFRLFVDFFVAAGRNINARNDQGHTLLRRIEQHRESGDYAEVMRTAGAVAE